MVIHISGSVHDTSGRESAACRSPTAKHVVTTDPAGRYAIEAVPPTPENGAESSVQRGLGGHHYIFVSLPDGHTADGGFYRPTPRSSGALDFTFDKQPGRQSPDFLLAHITDTHIGTHDGQIIGTDELGEDLARLKSETGPGLVVTTGDLTDEGTLSELGAYDEIARSTGAPVFSVFGGHDGNEELHGPFGRGATCTRNYRQVFGPAYYSFDWGGRHFVAYANEDYYFSPYDLIYKQRWLRQDLALQPEGRETVVMMHAPPSRQFLDSIQSYNVTLVLHGHTHSSKVFTYGRTTVAGLTPLRFGGVDTNPRGYRAVEFKRRGFDFEMVPMGRGRRSRLPGSAVAGTQSRAVGSLVWETPLPANSHRATPVVLDGDLLVALQDESSRGENGVCRVSGDTGDEMWRVRTDSAVRNSVSVAANGACLAFTSCGRVYCIDADLGEVRWQVDTPGFPDRWVASSPAVSDDTVYVGAKSGYAAYDLETGQEHWHTGFAGTYDLIADAPGDKWGCYASPLVYDNLLITFVPRRGLVALDRATGWVTWELLLDGTEDYWARPVLVGDRLVSGGELGEILVVAPRSGEVLWRAAVLSPGEPAPSDSGLAYASGLTVDQGRIFAATSQGAVVCCDLLTGDVRWTFTSGHDLLDMTPGRRGITSLLASPGVAEGWLLVPALDGVLYKLDAETGERVGETRFESPLTAAPCLLDDGFVVATWDGRLHRYRL